MPLLHAFESVEDEIADKFSAQDSFCLGELDRNATSTSTPGPTPTPNPQAALPISPGSYDKESAWVSDVVISHRAVLHMVFAVAALAAGLIAIRLVINIVASIYFSSRFSQDTIPSTEDGLLELRGQPAIGLRKGTLQV